jgi:hypothetical protein
MWQQLPPEQQRLMWENMHRWGYGPGMMGRYGRGYGMGPGMKGVWAGLGLSEAQTAQLIEPSETCGLDGSILAGHSRIRRGDFRRM